jgi:hypothetical protein
MQSARTVTTCPPAALAMSGCVTLSYADASGTMRIAVPLGAVLGHGDTVLLGERWL